VSREQLLEAVRGAGMADVMNAAMNSAWTHWLPGEHRNCSGTLTKAAHAPPGGTREHCLSRKRHFDHFLALPGTSFHIVYCYCSLALTNQQTLCRIPAATSHVCGLLNTAGPGQAATAFRPSFPLDAVACPFPQARCTVECTLCVYFSKQLHHNVFGCCAMHVGPLLERIVRWKLGLQRREAGSFTGCD
jgi:hypothetical protein